MIRTVLWFGLTIILHFGIDHQRAASQVFWADADHGIFSVDTDGSNFQSILPMPHANNPSGLAIDARDQKMYWTDGGINRISRANLDGTNVEDLVSTGLGNPLGIALDLVHEKMYWTDTVVDQIKRADLNGTNVEVLVSGGLDVPFGIALDIARGKIYWADEGGAGRKIQSANFEIPLGENASNRSDIVDVVTGLAGPRYLALDLNNDEIYWTDGGVNASIGKARLDGTMQSTILSSVNLPNGIALDIAGNKMYWADEGLDKIQYANLDGSNVTDLVTSGLSNPLGIALVAVPEPDCLMLLTILSLLLFYTSYRIR